MIRWYYFLYSPRLTISRLKLESSKIYLAGQQWISSKNKKVHVLQITTCLIQARI